MNRLAWLVGAFFLIAFTSFTAPAAEQLAQVKPTENPYLWRIEGKTPSYLFGTMHSPDPRVTTLHSEVKKALRAVDAIYTEIPLDTASTMSMVRGMRLPAGQTITKLLPPDLYQRLDAEYRRISPTLSLKMMDTQKLFIAMSAPTLLEQQFKFPGKKALDQKIWDIGQQLGKKLDGIETMDEHLAVFDALDVDEQIEMLRMSLDLGDKLREKGQHPVEDMIAIYLSGTTNEFRAKFFESSGEDNPILQKFYQAIMTVRNESMAERIHEKFRSEPEVARFYAIGAAHYGDGDGLVDLLQEKGLEITRVVPLDPPK